MSNDYDMLDGMGVEPEAAAILVTTRNEQRPEPGQHRAHLLLLYEPIFSIVFWFILVCHSMISCYHPSSLDSYFLHHYSMI